MNGALWRVAFGLALLSIASTCNQRSQSLQIGCITPLTGEGAAYGAATKRGLDLAVDKINSTGGINGQSVSVIYEDDQMSGAVANSALEKLTAIDKVPVIIGAFGSSVTLAIAPKAEQKKIVLFSASSTADAIKDAGEYIFRNVPPNNAQGKTAADFALTRLNARTAVVLHMNNDYGVSLSNAFRPAFQAGGGKIVSDESYNPGSSDFRAQLTKIRGLRPDLVFFPGHYQESGIILRQAKELGVTAIFFGGDGSYAPELIKLAGGAADGSYYTVMAMGDPASDKEAQSFISSFRAKYAEEPDSYSAYAYDGLMVVAEAVRRGGYSPDGIKKELYGLQGFKGVTGLTEFDANGEVNKPYGVFKVQDGKFVRVF